MVTYYLITTMFIEQIVRIRMLVDQNRQIVRQYIEQVINTGGIDLLVNPTKKNAQNIMSALEEFGVGSVGLSATDFQSLDNVIQ